MCKQPVNGGELGGARLLIHVRTVCYHMELGTRDTLLTVGTAAMLLGGIALIFVQNATLTTVGIVLVVLSAIAFIVDVKDLVVKTDRNARE